MTHWKILFHRYLSHQLLPQMIYICWYCLFCNILVLVLAKWRNEMCKCQWCKKKLPSLSPITTLKQFYYEEHWSYLFGETLCVYRDVIQTKTWHIGCPATLHRSENLSYYSYLCLLFTIIRPPCTQITKNQSQRHFSRKILCWASHNLKIIFSFTYRVSNIWIHYNTECLRRWNTLFLAHIKRFVLKIQMNSRACFKWFTFCAENVLCLIYGKSTNEPNAFLMS